MTISRKLHPAVQLILILYTVFTMLMDLSRFRQLRMDTPTDDLLVAMDVTKSHLLEWES